MPPKVGLRQRHRRRRLRGIEVVSTFPVLTTRQTDMRLSSRVCFLQKSFNIVLFWTTHYMIS